jgi:hypothetical protein
MRRVKATPPDKREFYKRATNDAKPGDPKPGTYLQDESFFDFTGRVQDTVSKDLRAYYRREIVARDDVQVADTLEQNKLVSKLILQANQSGKYACNKGACFAGQKPCEFVPVCSGKTTLSDTTLYQVRKKQSPLAEEF